MRAFSVATAGVSAAKAPGHPPLVANIAMPNIASFFISV
jgi:hypothetical protein